MSYFLGRGLTHQDFLEILVKLNHWKWDERVGDKPEGLDDMTTDQKYEILKPYLRELQKLVSEYDWLRYSNCEIKEYEFRMTYEEFDTFYEREMLREASERQNHGYSGRDKREDRDDQDNKIIVILFSLLAFILGFLTDVILKL